MYLLDTNVISAAAPSRVRRVDLTAWMDLHSAILFLSALTVAEIEDGIAKAKREGATRKAADLALWLDAVIHLYVDRILAFDIETARIAGGLSDRARGQGQAPGFGDILIGATALRHDLIILSRNVRHFAPLGLPVHDPFATLPPA